MPRTAPKSKYSRPVTPGMIRKIIREEVLGAVAGASPTGDPRYAHMENGHPGFMPGEGPPPRTLPPLEGTHNRHMASANMSKSMDSNEGGSTRRSKNSDPGDTHIVSGIPPPCRRTPLIPKCPNLHGGPTRARPQYPRPEP